MPSSLVELLAPFETRSLLKFTRSHLRCFAETSQLEREKMLAVEVLRL